MASKGGDSYGVWTERETKEGWDYDTYHIRTTNEHDHSEVLNLARTIKMPQSLLAQIHHWVDHPLTPYRTPSDVVRDAVAHRMAYLAEREGVAGLQSFANANNFYHLQQQIAADEAFDREMSDGLEALNRRANDLARGGHVKKLDDLYIMAKGIQVEPEHRARWLKAVEDIRVQCERLLPEI